MCDAMVKNLNDPVLVTEILDEMTEHANRMLEPFGYGIGWRMPWSKKRRLKRIEGLLTEQEHLAEAEDLKALAESARTKLLGFLSMACAGVPIPASAVQHDGPHHEVLRQRLSETYERLKAHGIVRERRHDRPR